eukprot:scaffold2519_cov124-Cylindrotheca_fusiformis.AAC.2
MALKDGFQTVVPSIFRKMKVFDVLNRLRHFSDEGVLLLRDVLEEMLLICVKTDTKVFLMAMRA